MSFCEPDDIVTQIDVGPSTFGSLLKSSYHIPYLKSLERERSIESPYTSLGSTENSYASIRMMENYGSLKAKAERVTEAHESKSKAVVEALQSLQKKIQRLESDRVQAEKNLKCLASETSDYKQLLEQKKAIEKNDDVHNTHSKELEGQLEHAQNKCQILEKQLEYMRQMMHNNVLSTSKPASPNDPVPQNSSSPYAVTASSQFATSPSVSSNRHLTSLGIHSPAMEKLNELEKEHKKLTASQSMAEHKIRELEEKIREEKHYRKLLQDKAAELQHAFATNMRSPSAKVEKNVQPKKTRNPKKVVHSFPNQLSRNTMAKYPEPLCSPSCSSHLTSIPFVVGQSTARSHSVGANIQNVLSIMKRHSKLCDQGTVIPKRSKLRTSSDKEMNKLLTTLQDELAQLGFEHREVSSQLQVAKDDNIITDLERELERVVEKMEQKGTQITTIRDHLLRSNCKKTRPRRVSHNQQSVKLHPDQEVEIVTTVRSKEVQNHVKKNNPNLDILKKARKLQCTLRKDDLKWD